jgi:hypothetical protein
MFHLNNPYISKSGISLLLGYRCTARLEGQVSVSLQAFCISLCCRQMRNTIPNSSSIVVHTVVAVRNWCFMQSSSGLLYNISLIQDCDFRHRITHDLF